MDEAEKGLAFLGNRNYRQKSEINMKLKRIYIEISNVCNLSCSFCAESNRAKRIMSLDEFKTVIQKIKPYCEYVYLHIKGEPLLHPQFNDILTVLNEENMKLQLVSNATFLANYPELIYAKCLRKISFSLHSIPFQKVEPKQYMQPILDFSNQAAKLKKPAVELRFWNRNHLDDKSKECLNMLLTQANLEATNRLGSYKWKQNVYVHFDEEFQWPSQANQNDQIGFCQGTRTMLGILSDGTVVPCCLDDQGTISLGNIFQQSFEEIIQSSRFVKMNEAMKQRRLVEPLCQKCSYRHRFD